MKGDPLAQGVCQRDAERHDPHATRAAVAPNERHAPRCGSTSCRMVTCRRQREGLLGGGEPAGTPSAAVNVSRIESSRGAYPAQWRSPDRRPTDAMTVGPPSW